MTLPSLAQLSQIANGYRKHLSLHLPRRIVNDKRLFFYIIFFSLAPNFISVPIKNISENPIKPLSGGGVVNVDKFALYIRRAVKSEFTIVINYLRNTSKT